MPDIKSVNAPAIGEAGLQRIMQWARPKRMNNTDTLFDMGYEQAKKDLLEMVYREVGIPAEDQHNLLKETREARLREARKPIPDRPNRGWWW